MQLSFAARARYAPVDGPTRCWSVVSANWQLLALADSMLPPKDQPQIGRWVYFNPEILEVLFMECLCIQLSVSSKQALERRCRH